MAACQYEAIAGHTGKAFSFLLFLLISNRCLALSLFFSLEMRAIIFRRNFRRIELQNDAILSQFMLNEDKDQEKKKRPKAL